MEIKITKRRLLWYHNTDKCCNWYWEVYGKIINDDRTRCRKFNFVVWYDWEDIAEYFDVDTVSKKLHREYLDEMISAQFTASINSYDDCRHFYQLCRESIDHYNDLCRRCA